MDSPIVVNWVNPLSFLGVIGVIFIFYLIFDEICHCKQNSPRWDAMFCGIPSEAILFAHVPQKGRSGRASDSESGGPGFDPHRRHRVVSLSKTH